MFCLKRCHFAFLASLYFCRGSLCSPPGRQLRSRGGCASPSPAPSRLRGSRGRSPRSSRLRCSRGRSPRSSRPPGGPRRSARAGNSARAASRDSHSRPRSNHIMTAEGCFSFSRFSVGCSSSTSCARKAVGWLSTRMVQYAWRGGIRSSYVLRTRAHRRTPCSAPAQTELRFNPTIQSRGHFNCPLISRKLDKRAGV